MKWSTFHDHELSQLVEWAVASNLDLRMATANLLEARALRLGAKSDFYPVVNGVASYSHNTYSDSCSFSTLSGGEFRPPGTSYNVGFDATWELDFFGRVRRGFAASVASKSRPRTTHATQSTISPSASPPRLPEIILNCAAPRANWKCSATIKTIKPRRSTSPKPRLDAGGGH